MYKVTDKLYYYCYTLGYSVRITYGFRSRSFTYTQMLRGYSGSWDFKACIFIENLYSKFHMTAIFPLAIYFIHR